LSESLGPLVSKNHTRIDHVRGAAGDMRLRRGAIYVRHLKKGDKWIRKTGSECDGFGATVTRPDIEAH
jgi:hypothetical protein